MEIKLKSSLSQKKTLVILSLLCLLLGVISILVGDMLLPFTGALLALIFVFDGGKKRIGIITSVLLVLINALAIGLKVGLNLVGLESVVFAVLFFTFFVKRREKSEAIFVLTVVCAIFSVINLALIPIIELNTLNFAEVLSYYEGFISELRTLYVQTTYEAYAMMMSVRGIEITEAMVSAAFDAQLSMVISYIVIVGFVLVGISMKTFDAVFSRIAEDKSPVISWRFMTSNVFAYFYIILVVLSILTSMSNGVLGIAVGNLYNIFMVVYAYVGFNYAVAVLSIKFKPSTSIIILLVITLLAMSMALGLLAMFGVLFTIRKNRELSFKEEQ